MGRTAVTMQAMLSVSRCRRGLCTSTSKGPCGGFHTPPMFYDMKHSNNAARIRIWRQKKGVQDKVDRTVVEYPDLKTPMSAKLNPLLKVPAIVLSNGSTIFESPVILDYLEDKYAEDGPSFRPDNHEEKARMNLFIRIHDLYIASPNSTQPGFSHTQGCMY